MVMRGGERGGEAHLGSARGRAAIAGDGARHASRWPCAGSALRQQRRQQQRKRAVLAREREAREREAAVEQQRVTRGASRALAVPWPNWSRCPRIVEKYQDVTILPP
jgi:hypothetical protein